MKFKEINETNANMRAQFRMDKFPEYYYFTDPKNENNKIKLNIKLNTSDKKQKELLKNAIVDYAEMMPSTDRGLTPQKFKKELADFCKINPNYKELYEKLMVAPDRSIIQLVMPYDMGAKDYFNGGEIGKAIVAKLISFTGKGDLVW